MAQSDSICASDNLVYQPVNEKPVLASNERSRPSANMHSSSVATENWAKPASAH